MDYIFQIGSAIGFTVIMTTLISIGRKLQILDDMREDIRKLKHNTNAIANFLTKNSEFDLKELQPFSPLQLTDIGKGLISSLGFDKVFADHKQEFFSLIDEEQPKLKYDVEIAAIKAIAALYDQDYMQFLKIYMYNNPTRNLENIAPTLGVYIRDAYLAEHGEIVE